MITLLLFCFPFRVFKLSNVRQSKGLGQNVAMSFIFTYLQGLLTRLKAAVHLLEIIKNTKIWIIFQESIFLLYS